VRDSETMRALVDQLDWTIEIPPEEGRDTIVPTVKDFLASVAGMDEVNWTPGTRSPYGTRRGPEEHHSGALAQEMGWQGCTRLNSTASRTRPTSAPPCVQDTSGTAQGAS
jgi:hypothetical protein